MTVQDLLMELEGYAPDTEVRFASQPSWPFEYSIDSVVSVTPEDEEYPVIYLTEGTQLGYLPGNVKDEIGW